MSLCLRVWPDSCSPTYCRSLTGQSVRNRTNICVTFRPCLVYALRSCR